MKFTLLFSTDSKQVNKQKNERLSGTVKEKKRVLC